MLRELRQTLRILVKSPSFTAVAVLTLALGIGANTTMFSVVNGVLLRSLDYPNASRILQLKTFFLQENRSIPRLTGPDFIDLRAGTSAVEQMSFYWGGEMGVQLGGRAEYVETYFVAPNFFKIFGITPEAGRGFEDRSSQNANAAAQRGAIIGESFAWRNFGSQAAALGRTVSIEGVAYPIVGVVSSNFSFPNEAQVWIEASSDPEKPWGVSRTSYNYRVLGLLRPGVTLETANAQLATIATLLQAAYPDSNAHKSFLAIPLREQLVGSVRSTLYCLTGAVVLVLLIACANVANLMLARATVRQREMAVRSALGATRMALARQLLLESSVIAVAAGALGLLLAVLGTRTLTQAGAEHVGLPRLHDIQVNWIVFFFAAGMSLLSTFLFGISPAVQASKVDLNEALRQAARGLAGTPNRLRNALVVVQVALSFALGIGAGLLFHSFIRLNSIDLGYKTRGMLVMSAHDPARTLDDHLRAGRFLEIAVNKIKGIPGVVAAGAVMGLPTGAYGSNGGYSVDGEEFRPQANRNFPQAIFTLTSPGYFSTMEIPLLRGRDFDSGDSYDRPFVAIISESLARQSFAGKDPIGHPVMFGLEGSPKWMTVVGVVADVRQDSPASLPSPTLYTPLLQHPFYANEVTVAVRTAVEPASLIEPLRSTMRSLNPDVAIKFTTLEAMVSDSIATPRLRTLLLGLFAVLALLLAVAGMYGVMSYITAQRIPEFGVRIALGASPSNVLGLVLKRAARLTGLGVAIGLVLAFFMTRVIDSMLFGLKHTDGITYATALLALTPIVVLAAAVPAWRASRVDPAVALRSD